MEYLVQNAQEIFNVVTTAVALCSAIAALTPTEKDDKIVQAIMKVVNVVGFNFGFAKNKD